MRALVFVLLVAFALPLAACGDDKSAAPPPPRPLDPDALAYYCGMVVADHPGPKGQIILTDRDDPIWFSSVRDAIAFTLSPSEPRNIAAFYVNDMTDTDWNKPGPDTWIDAYRAWYVIGSDKRGGMGAPEAIPFKEKAAAEAFAATHGGSVVSFDAMPKDYILKVPDAMPKSPDGGSMPMPSGSMPSGSTGSSGD